MKTNLLILFFALVLYSGKSQTYYMCGTTTVSTAFSGNLYDSGGPSGNYSSNQSCYFLIKAPCPGNISLSFSYFDTELSYDYVTVYNGSTTASPILGSYWGSGSVPTMVANSGFMLVYFYSDYTANYGGFAATWQMSTTGCAPVANFTSNVNACQGSVAFTDQSISAPTSWLWNFGDGNASAMQNPVHTYTAAGLYNVTLLATNNYGSSTITKTVQVNPIQFKIGYAGLPLMNSPISFTTDYTSASVYYWTFGDGGVAGSANAIHTYTSMGTFSVSLTAASGTCSAVQNFQLKINDGVGIKVQDLKPYQAKVLPNPFSNASSLHLQLAKDVHMDVKIFDQLGRQVNSLVNSDLHAGEYQYSIKDLSAGVYYLQIRGNNSVETIRIISID